LARRAPCNKQTKSLIGHFADNLAAPAFVGYWGNSGQTSSAPRRLEIRHRLLARNRDQPCRDQWPNLNFAMADVALHIDLAQCANNPFD
jgi:hypothetical protein